MEQLAHAGRETRLGGQEERDDPSGSADRLLVLVADDEATARLILKASVERCGHECVVARDGDDAWKLIRERPFDVLITDWMMPGVDGPELCRRIRGADEFGYVYIILATSLSNREHVLIGMEAGADDYLTKPVDPFNLKVRLVAAQRVMTLHKHVLAKLMRLNEELTELARTDPLTQLGNRLRLHEDLAALHDRAIRYDQPYSLAILDLDCFKSFNDTFGHLAGDAALRSVAATLTASIRGGDCAYRYGGEEFVVVFANQQLAESSSATDRLRTAVEHRGLRHSGSPAGVMTISAGVSSWRPHFKETPAEVFARADTALYRSKQLGRNRVSAAVDADEASADGSAASSPQVPISTDEPPGVAGHAGWLSTDASDSVSGRGYELIP
jgi:diguanylate cyclase (GGDEF)-like protein